MREIATLRAILQVSDHADIGSPAVAVDPNGLLSLEWLDANWCRLTVAFDSEGVVYHAALLGAERHTGRAEGVTDALRAVMAAYRDYAEAVVAGGPHR